MKLIDILSVLSYISLTTALYSSKDDVIDLTDSNFDKSVINSDDIWVVEFYAPWCGHCQQFASEYAKAAKALKGVVKVGGVNADEHKSIGGRFGVRGFPTVKIFGVNKNKPEDYSGQRTAQAVVDAALAALKAKVYAQMGVKSSGKKSSNDVIELTESNFEKMVLESEDMWLVEFFAPWCGHCKNLEPHWAQAATELKGKVKLGAVDATVHQSKAGEYGVKGYPTIKYFPAGKKDKRSAEDYTGGRTSTDIVNWAMDKLAENIPAPEILEIKDQSVLKNECEGKPLCVISILPHILDCQSACRNDYLAVLKTMGEKFKKKMWGWVWAEAGAQPNVEESLEIGGFGYPAMAVLNAKKMKFSILRGSFSADGINEFLRDLSYGRGTTAPLRGAEMPKVSKIEGWDGKDGVLPEEEDSDSDLGKEEL